MRRNLLFVVQEDRMNTIISLVSSIQNLMEELDLPPSTPLDNRIFGSLAIPSAGGVPVLQTPEVRFRPDTQPIRFYQMLFLQPCVFLLELLSTVIPLSPFHLLDSARHHLLGSTKLR